MADPIADQQFVLHDDGVWMYYLGAEGQRSWRNKPIVPQADGQPMTRLQKDGWWAVGHEAATITVARPQAPKTIGYRLRDLSAASPRFPADLTVEQWENRREDADFLWGLYNSVTEEQPDEVITIDGPWLRLDGAPPPADDSRTWLVRLPDALLNRREYHHLFPGVLAGFRDHIKHLAERHRYKQFVFEDQRGKHGISVTLQVPFDQPVTEYQPARNQDGTVSRSRNGKTVTVYARRELLLDVPDRIPGANRAAATAEWDRLTVHYQRVLDEAGVAACSHCRGHGYVPSGADEVPGA